MTATTGVDIVEVLRGTSASPWLVAAGSVGGLAAIATAATAVAWWRTPRRRRDARPTGTSGVTTVAGVALAASLLEAVLLLADGAGPGDRWLLVTVTRILLLGTLLALPRSGPDRLVGTGTRPALGGLLLATAVLGTPATAAAGRLWLATAVVGSVAVLLHAGRTVAVRLRRGLVSGPTVALVIVLGVPVAIWSTPDRLPDHHQERVAVDDLVLDLTIAPVQSGTNEAHLYAFDRHGGAAPVSEVDLAVVGRAGSSHRMFEVSPDHHLSYVLELPPTPPWRVRFTLVGPDGRCRETTLHLDPR